MSLEPPPTGSTQEISKAIAEISERAQVLIRDEVELAKLELTGKAKTIGRGAAVAIAAGVFVIFAVSLILNGLSWLAWYLLPVPDTAYFWGFFLIAGILLIVAGLAGWFAYRALQTKPTPDMAIEEAQRIRDTIAPHEEPGAPGPAGPGGPVPLGVGGAPVPTGVSVPPGAPTAPAPGVAPPPDPVTPPAPDPPTPPNDGVA